MAPKLIFEPVLALAALTFLVLLYIPIMRVAAVRSGAAHIKDFRFGDTETVPERARLVNRNLISLLQVPVLFYLACIILFSLQSVTQLSVYIAWVFVSLRLLHSLVHIGYNNVNHRFGVFALSVLVLIGLWWQVAIAVLNFE